MGQLGTLIWYMYCRVGYNGTRDVAITLAQPDRRKSKFGLRHAIKQNNFYCVTKSEFWFSMIGLSNKSNGNVPNPESREGKLPNQLAHGQTSTVIFLKFTRFLKIPKKYGPVRYRTFRIIYDRFDSFLFLWQIFSYTSTYVVLSPKKWCQNGIVHLVKKAAAGSCTRTR